MVNLSSQAVSILEKRYLLRDEDGNLIETPDDMFRRVAKAAASVEKHQQEFFESIFYQMMVNLDFLPNSPVLMNLGTKKGCGSACFVLNLSDSMEDILQVARDAVMIEKFGGGVGFSLSDLRPKDYPIATTHGKACGPIAVLKYLSAGGNLVTQAGKRDGAHMAVMSVYHPDIFEFIKCKQVEGDISNFNISVGADHAFMKAVEKDYYIKLSWPIEENVFYTEEGVKNIEGNFVRAREIFDAIVAGAWKNGEPGMVWLDRMNEDNFTPQLGTIKATNPCGEEPLLHREQCCLGSINVANFVDEENKRFDVERLKPTIVNAVCFLDNVIDAQCYATKEIEEMNKKTRKIGLGIMGWADALIKMNIPYDSDLALEEARKLAILFRSTAREQSYRLGKTKGSYLAFVDGSFFHDNVYNQSYDVMRNSWVLSIAPTGTISMIAGCSFGIEPLFALSYRKQNMSGALSDDSFEFKNEELCRRFEAMAHLRQFDGKHDHLTAEHMLKTLADDQKKIFVTSKDIVPYWHIAHQAVFQNYVDAGVSKTINLPNDASMEDVRDIYTSAWSMDCKGITIYRDGSREKEVIVDSSKTGTINLTIAQNSATIKQRPQTMQGETIKVVTGHGSLYVTLNRSDDGLFEVFGVLGKGGKCNSANVEAIARLISLSLRSGVSRDAVIGQLRDISCCPQWHQGQLIQSIPDAFAYAMQEPEKVKEFIDSNGELCPECDSYQLIRNGGCASCVCGYQKC